MTFDYEMVDDFLEEEVKEIIEKRGIATNENNINN